MLYYFVISFIIFVVISFLPQLLYFGLIVWLVLTIVRALSFDEKRTRRYEDKQERYRQSNQNQHKSSSDEIIDVEYREREVDED